MVLKIRYFFHIFGPSSLITCPIHVKITLIGYFWPNFPNLRSKSHDSNVFGTYWENIDFGYRLLISFLSVIRPSDCHLKYHFGPKVLENGRKKLYILRFLQLVFVMTSPLGIVKKIKIYLFLIFYHFLPNFTIFYLYFFIFYVNLRKKR
jgi:hypothetical protein